MVTFINTEFPHTAVIRRSVASASPPFTVTTTDIWSGAVDCQVNSSGGTGKRENVFVSDYAIYSACISPEIKTGDTITISGTGKTAFSCIIKQSTTEDIYEVDGVMYGTTIWANEIKS